MAERHLLTMMGEKCGISSPPDTSVSSTSCVDVALAPPPEMTALDELSILEQLCASANKVDCGGDTGEGEVTSSSEIFSALCKNFSSSSLSDEPEKDVFSAMTAEDIHCIEMALSTDEEMKTIQQNVMKDLAIGVNPNDWSISTEHDPFTVTHRAAIDGSLEPLLGLTTPLSSSPLATVLPHADVPNLLLDLPNPVLSLTADDLTIDGDFSVGIPPSSDDILYNDVLDVLKSRDASDGRLFDDDDDDDVAGRSVVAMGAVAMGMTRIDDLVLPELRPIEDEERRSDGLGLEEADVLDIDESLLLQSFSFMDQSHVMSSFDFDSINFNNNDDIMNSSSEEIKDTIASKQLQLRRSTRIHDNEQRDLAERIRQENIQMEMIALRADEKQQQQQQQSNEIEKNKKSEMFCGLGGKMPEDKTTSNDVECENENDYDDVVADNDDISPNVVSQKSIESVIPEKCFAQKGKMRGKGLGKGGGKSDGKNGGKSGGKSGGKGGKSGRCSKPAVKKIRGWNNAGPTVITISEIEMDEGREDGVKSVEGERSGKKEEEMSKEDKIGGEEEMMTKESGKVEVGLLLEMIDDEDKIIIDKTNKKNIQESSNRMNEMSDSDVNSILSDEKLKATIKVRLGRLDMMETTKSMKSDNEDEDEGEGGGGGGMIVIKPQMARRRKRKRTEDVIAGNDAFVESIKRSKSEEHLKSVSIERERIKSKSSDDSDVEIIEMEEQPKKEILKCDEMKIVKLKSKEKQQPTREAKVGKEGVALHERRASQKENGGLLVVVKKTHSTEDAREKLNAVKKTEKKLIDKDLQKSKKSLVRHDKMKTKEEMVVKKKQERPSCLYPGCLTSVQMSSAYCSNVCLLKYAKHVMNMYKIDDNQVKSSENQQKSFLGVDELVMLERSTGKCRTLPNSFPKRKVLHWLLGHPTFEIRKPKKPPTQLDTREKIKLKIKINGDNAEIKTVSIPSAVATITRRMNEETTKNKSCKSFVKTLEKTFVKRVTSSFDFLSSKEAKNDDDAQRLAKKTKPSSVNQQQTKDDNSNNKKVQNNGSTTSNKPKTNSNSSSNNNRNDTTTTTTKEFTDCPEPARTRVRTELCSILTSRTSRLNDILLSGSEIKRLTLDVENELWKFSRSVTIDYKRKYRELILHLKDPKNQGLFRRVLCGHVKPNELVQMNHSNVDSSFGNNKQTGNKSTNDKPIKSDFLSSAMTDATSKHGQHIFDVNCRICAGKSKEIKKLPVGDGHSNSKSKGTGVANREVQSEDSAIKAGKGWSSELSLAPNDKETKQYKEKISVDVSDSSLDKSGRSESDVVFGCSSWSHGKVVTPENGSYSDNGTKEEPLPVVDFFGAFTGREFSEGGFAGGASWLGKEEEEEPLPPWLLTSPVIIPKNSPDATSDLIDPRDRTRRIPKMSESLGIIKQYSSFDDDVMMISHDHHQLQQPMQSSSLDENDLLRDGGGSVWIGNIFAQDVANVSVNATFISGSMKFIRMLLPETLTVMGRLLPEIVFEYLTKIKTSYSTTKEIAVICFRANDDLSAGLYSQLYAYLQQRNRCGVIGSIGTAIKDMYILPLPHRTPVPDVLQTNIGPSLDRSRDLLLGVVVQQTNRAAARSNRLMTARISSNRLKKTEAKYVPMDDVATNKKNLSPNYEERIDPELTKLTFDEVSDVDDDLSDAAKNDEIISEYTKSMMIIKETPDETLKDDGDEPYDPFDEDDEFMTTTTTSSSSLFPTPSTNPNESLTNLMSVLTQLSLATPLSMTTADIERRLIAALAAQSVVQGIEEQRQILTQLAVLLEDHVRRQQKQEILLQSHSNAIQKDGLSKDEILKSIDKDDDLSSDDFDFNVKSIDRYHRLKSDDGDVDFISDEKCNNKDGRYHRLKSDDGNVGFITDEKCNNKDGRYHRLKSNVGDVDFITDEKCKNKDGRFRLDNVCKLGFPSKELKTSNKKSFVYNEQDAINYEDDNEEDNLVIDLDGPTFESASAALNISDDVVNSKDVDDDEVAEAEELKDSTFQQQSSVSSCIVEKKDSHSSSAIIEKNDASEASVEFGSKGEGATAPKKMDDEVDLNTRYSNDRQRLSEESLTNWNDDEAKTRESNELMISLADDDDDDDGVVDVDDDDGVVDDDDDDDDEGKKDFEWSSRLNDKDEASKFELEATVGKYSRSFDVADLKPLPAPPKPPDYLLKTTRSCLLPDPPLIPPSPCLLSPSLLPYSLPPPPTSVPAHPRPLRLSLSDNAGRDLMTGFKSTEAEKVESQRDGLHVDVVTLDSSRRRSYSAVTTKIDHCLNDDSLDDFTHRDVKTDDDDEDFEENHRLKDRSDEVKIPSHDYSTVVDEGATISDDDRELIFTIRNKSVVAVATKDDEDCNDLSSDDVDESLETRRRFSSDENSHVTSSQKIARDERDRVRGQFERRSNESKSEAYEYERRNSSDCFKTNDDSSLPSRLHEVKSRMTFVGRNHQMADDPRGRTVNSSNSSHQMADNPRSRTSNSSSSSHQMADDRRGRTSSSSSHQMAVDPRGRTINSSSSSHQMADDPRGRTINSSSSRVKDQPIKKYDPTFDARRYSRSNEFDRATEERSLRRKSPKQIIERQQRIEKYRELYEEEDATFQPLLSSEELRNYASHRELSRRTSLDSRSLGVASATGFGLSSVVERNSEKNVMSVSTMSSSSSLVDGYAQRMINDTRRRILESTAAVDERRFGLTVRREEWQTMGNWQERSQVEKEEDWKYRSEMKEAWMKQMSQMTADERMKKQMNEEKMKQMTEAWMKRENEKGLCRKQGKEPQVLAETYEKNERDSKRINDSLKEFKWRQIEEEEEAEEGECFEDDNELIEHKLNQKTENENNGQNYETRLGGSRGLNFDIRLSVPLEIRLDDKKRTTEGDETELEDGEITEDISPPISSIASAPMTSSSAFGNAVFLRREPSPQRVVMTTTVPTTTMIPTRLDCWTPVGRSFVPSEPTTKRHHGWLSDVNNDVDVKDRFSHDPPPSRWSLSFYEDRIVSHDRRTNDEHDRSTYLSRQSMLKNDKIWREGTTTTTQWSSEDVTRRLSNDRRIYPPL